MSELTREDALKLISLQLAKANEALKEAARIAKKYDIDYVNWESVHEGMAGYLDEGRWEPANSNWDSSSASC